jgi:hypothetical protein
VQASAPEWLEWMDALFANAGNGRGTDKCTSATREPLSNVFVKQPPEGGEDLAKTLKHILHG